MIYRIIFFLIILFGFLCAQKSKLYIDNPSDIFPLYYHAIESAADGYFEESIPVFHKMLTLFHGHQEAILLLDICNNVLVKKISADAGEIFFQGVDAAANFDNRKRVLELYEEAIAEEKNYFPFYLIRGEYFVKEKMYDRALSDFSKSVQLAPAFAMGYYNRGQLYLTMENKQQALQDFNVALTLNPRYTLALIQRGKIYAETGTIENALADFQLARAIDPLSTKKLEYSAILNNIGAIYINRNNFEMAISALSEALEADDRWYEPYLNRGIAYRSVQDFDRALTDLNKAIELKPQIGKTWYNRGLTYKEKKEYISAEKDLIRSLAFADTDIRIFYTLAEVYQELKKYNEATDYYKKAINAEADNIWAYFQLGGLYDKRRDFESAVTYYEQFLKLASNDYFKHKINIKERVDKLKKYIKQQKTLLEKDN
ncbi:tetratricopeptide repeat protein [Calditrichota bacterium]